LKARKRGIIDEEEGQFFNTKTGERMALNDAVDAGHVKADFDADSTSESGSSSSQCETKTYAVSGVVDQVRRLK
jgi:hypothetical protein